MVIADEDIDLFVIFDGITQYNERILPKSGSGKIPTLIFISMAKDTNPNKVAGAGESIIVALCGVKYSTKTLPFPVLFHSF